MLKQVQADMMKQYFRRLDTRDCGFISRERMVSLLCELGMARESVDQLFCMTSFVNSSGEVAYGAFVDWLIGGIPEVVYAKSVCSSPKNQSPPEYLADLGLRGLSRARRILWEGQRFSSADMLAELDAFLSIAMKAEVQDRMRSVWSVAIAGTDAGRAPANMAELASTDAELWDEFAKRCLQKLLSEVFSMVDLDEDGNLSAQELMTFLMLVTVQKDSKFALSPADAEQTVQEFDIAGDGRLSKAEFLHMVNVLEREVLTGPERLTPAIPPHLVLYFDVNNTILFSDTLTGADAEDLISMTLAGCAWGIKIPRSNGGDCWVQVCPEPKATQPWVGLISYTGYVVQANPLPASQNSTEVEAVKQRRRQALRSFCKAENPGQTLRPHLDKLLAALKCDCKLLPSFFFLLLELKRAGRSFTVVFRTFGTDIDSDFEREFNSFCEGQHPLFPGLVFDGTDGLPDYRMNLSGGFAVGTFFRRADEIGLIWGTHQQPPKGLGFEFYDDVPGATVITGAAKVVQSLERVCGHSGTLALRDFYPGWANSKFSSRGGKPLFLRIEDDNVMSVFFDDHIRPVDPNIVDPIDVRDFPVRLPMAQVYNIHCVPAVPLHSISELSYFWDELLRCEEAKSAQLLRRRKVAAVLHDFAAIRRVIELLVGDTSRPLSSQMRRQVSIKDPSIAFTPWREMTAVKHATPFVGIS